ncbi:MAG: hypothetical protein NT113_23545, partial [Hyphomicrobiales bacterium]|nr:hypothetical protein [Hyphomicrobiales bacterium]
PQVSGNEVLSSEGAEETSSLMGRPTYQRAGSNHIACVGWEELNIWDIRPTRKITGSTPAQEILLLIPAAKMGSWVSPTCGEED